MNMKTTKGTELPIADIKGKPYLQVAHRLVWFREEHQDWGIETQAELVTESSARYRAIIRDDSGRIIATATKQEDKQGFFDFVEKAETGAIGRALALCGYGTQFAPELEEGERIVDSPISLAKRPISHSVTSETHSASPADQMRQGMDKALDQSSATTPYCAVHHKSMRLGKYGYYCPTKVGNGWCKEKPSMGAGATAVEEDPNTPPF